MDVTRTTIAFGDYEMTVETGHTKKEWNKRFGDDGDLWDILFEEFLNGAVEPMDDIVYWYIDGRMYETDIPA